MRKFVLLFSLLVVVLSACRIESNMVFDINDDGSADVGVEIGLDDEFSNLISSQSGGSVDDFIEEIFSEIGDAAGIETRQEGDMTYFRRVTQVEDLSTWEWESSEGGWAFSDFSYESGDTNKFQATVTGVADADLGDFGFDPSALTGDFFKVNLIVKMPGEVKTSNADEVRDGALVWNIPLGGSITAQAESSEGSSGSTWLWIILGVLLLIAIASGIAAIILTKKGSEKAVNDAAAAHQAETAAAAALAADTATLEIDTTDVAASSASSEDTKREEEE